MKKAITFGLLFLVMTVLSIGLISQQVKASAEVAPTCTYHSSSIANGVRLLNNSHTFIINVSTNTNGTNLGSALEINGVRDPDRYLTPGTKLNDTPLINDIVPLNATVWTINTAHLAEGLYSYKVALNITNRSTEGTGEGAVDNVNLSRLTQDCATRTFVVDFPSSSTDIDPDTLRDEFGIEVEPKDGIGMESLLIVVGIILVIAFMGKKKR